MMEANVGTVDRWIRLILGAAAIIAALTGTFSGVGAWIAAIIGVVLVFTGLTSSCQLYRLFGFSTRPK